ncbi:serine/threonine protein kinase [Butyrivibrio sp. MC2013]|uniref:serine/threonine protein kinase n=1 Tax=Butyrivibrio sp. MC2013 TaxID=1280686 RepID=UPI0003FF472F|nr:protein kinase [Butyrivibrio sp. MC2013]
MLAILKENEDNTRTSRFSASRKESYQQKYWDEYLMHVKQCLRRDGYSDSDSSAETAARDTFYLERKDPSDFLSWFVSPDTLESAKRRIEELLISANRRSSNLKLDIKYYSRDLEYFYEFINGTSDGSHSQDEYQFIKNLKNKTNVQLVKNSVSGKLYVRKRYSEYNADVFKSLMNAEISGIPQLCEVEVKGKDLWTIEEYIEGKTLLEIFEKDGPFSEGALRPLVLELCGILSQLHDKDILHRDIKPSNIILSQENKVVLIDFNASKEYRDNANEDTVWAGTDYFAAPEQKGFGSSSRATDVFGVGATMSYLLTGMYYLQMIAPGAFHDVIKKCTEIDPKNRYQSMEELINALNEC